VREPSENHPIIIRYFPIIIRFSQGIYRRSSTDPKNNLPIIYRQIPRIYRSGCRDQGVELSDNHQMISGNRQIDSPVDRPSASPNRKLIVNRFSVIVNSAGWNLSPIHHQNAEIYHRADRPPAIRLWNHPINSENHPTDSANVPKICRRIAPRGDAEKRGALNPGHEEAEA